MLLLILAKIDGCPRSRKRSKSAPVLKPLVELHVMQNFGSEHPPLFGLDSDFPSIDCSSIASLIDCKESSLLEPDEILHPLDPASEPRPVRCLVQLLSQSSVVVRLAFRVHEGVGQRVALAQGVVQEKVCCVDLARFISLAGGCCLDTLLEETLEVSLCWAQAVHGPAS